MTGSVDQQRFAAGLSGAELARRNEWDPSKVSKIEYGRIKPSLEDITAYCRDCGAQDQLADLHATRQNIDTAYLEWRKVLGTGTKRRQQASIKWESESRILRSFEPSLIPGLLQTAEYATGILRKVIEFQQIPDDLDAGVAKRMERQQVLYKRDHLFQFLIGEQALYTTVGGNEAMLGQLDRLLAVHGMPRITIGIIPFMAPFETATTGFLMFDSTMVLVETVTAELNVTQPRDIRVYRRTFDTLAAQSVTGEKARTLIHRAIRARDSPRPIPSSDHL